MYQCGTSCGYVLGILFHKLQDSISTKLFSLLRIQIGVIVILYNAISIAILRNRIIIGSLIDKYFNS